MIGIEKMYEGVRVVGLNYGFPMTFIKLGDGHFYEKGEELVHDVIMVNKCEWVCILGKDTTQVGMGTLIRTLNQQFDLNVEVESEADKKTPGWLHSVDRWMVDYIEDPVFNYFSLRAHDMVRFNVEDHPDIGRSQIGMDSLGLCPAAKLLVVNVEQGGVPLFREATELATKYSRTRIYVKQPQ